MAVVIRNGDLYEVGVDFSALASFAHLLDAHCFALQLMERGIVQSVRLYSGVVVT